MMNLDALLSISCVNVRVRTIRCSIPYFEHKNAAYNRLADIVEEHLDMDYIMSTLG